MVRSPPDCCRPEAHYSAGQRPITPQARGLRTADCSAGQRPAYRRAQPSPTADGSDKMKKSATDLLVSVALVPPGSSLLKLLRKGLRAVDNPERLPLTFVRPLSTALPICSLTVPATPFPRKSRHRSRCEAPPPKYFATFVSEPDPNYFFPSALFSRAKVQQRACQKR